MSSPGGRERWEALALWGGGVDTVLWALARTLPWHSETQGGPSLLGIPALDEGDGPEQGVPPWGPRHSPALPVRARHGAKLFR